MQIVIISGELKQPSIPRMYCSRYLPMKVVHHLTTANSGQLPNTKMLDDLISNFHCLKCSMKGIETLQEQ